MTFILEHPLIVIAAWIVLIVVSLSINSMHIYNESDKQ
jgi:uncharacterized membrane protein YdfJ with MMPL/SSD domain